MASGSGHDGRLATTSQETERKRMEREREEEAASWASTGLATPCGVAQHYRAQTVARQSQPRHRSVPELLPHHHLRRAAMRGVTVWFGCARAIGAAKSVRFGNKTLTVSNLEIVLKRVKNKKIPLRRQCSPSSVRGRLPLVRGVEAATAQRHIEDFRARETKGRLVLGASVDARALVNHDHPAVEEAPERRGYGGGALGRSCSRRRTQEGRRLHANNGLRACRGRRSRFRGHHQRSRGAGRIEKEYCGMPVRAASVRAGLKRLPMLGQPRPSRPRPSHPESLAQRQC
jgi:hypothetical protein